MNAEELDNQNRELLAILSATLWVLEHPEVDAIKFAGNRGALRMFLRGRWSQLASHVMRQGCRLGKFTQKVLAITRNACIIQFMGSALLTPAPREQGLEQKMNAIKATKEQFIKAAEKAGWTFNGQQDDLLMFSRDDAIYGCAGMSAEVLNETTIWGDESVAKFVE